MAQKILKYRLLFFAFVLMLNCDCYSQIFGEWEIIEYRIEIGGLTPAEIKDVKKEVEGKLALIQDSVIILGESRFKGKMALSPKTFDVVDQMPFSDSTSVLLKFFCQEIAYFNAISRTTLRMFDKSYKGSKILVFYFSCAHEMECVYVYLLEKKNILVCVPGDGAYLLKRK
jgi:hypothetical protein